MQKGLTTTAGWGLILSKTPWLPWVGRVWATEASLVCGDEVSEYARSWKSLFYQWVVTAILQEKSNQLIALAWEDIEERGEVDGDIQNSESESEPLSVEKQLLGGSVVFVIMSWLAPLVRCPHRYQSHESMTRTNGKFASKFCQWRLRMRLRTTTKWTQNNIITNPIEVYIASVGYLYLY